MLNQVNPQGALGALGLLGIAYIKAQVGLFPKEGSLNWLQLFTQRKHEARKRLGLKPGDVLPNSIGERAF